MWVSEIAEENITDEIIDRLLFQGIEEDGSVVDNMIVLGSSKAYQYRVPVAARLF